MSAVPAVKIGSGMRVPVIDLGPYFAGEPRSLETTAAQLREASESPGFYFIANHGGAQSLIDRVFAETERFHSLPLEKKLAVKVGKMTIGYLPLGGQTQNTSVYAKSTHPDRSAWFYIHTEYPAEYPDRLAGRPWVQDNRWPADLPGAEQSAEISAVILWRVLRRNPQEELRFAVENGEETGC